VSLTEDTTRQVTAPTNADLIGLALNDGLTRNHNRRTKVKDLQLRLNEHGAILVVDGMFGAKTDAALKDAQTAAGLTSSNTVDPDIAQILSQPGGGSAATGLVGLSIGDGMTKATAERRPNVARLQQLLTEKESACSVDGKFGPGTLSALHQFQAVKALPRGDVVDQATSDTLEEVDGPQLCPPSEPPIFVNA
jgi:peptidoglycan hydrolase-like protein with peptidoglycan-binding domain